MMKTFGRFLGIGLVGSTLSWAAEVPPAGRAVEFSPPGAGSMPVKPLTERDIGARTFNFQTREGSAPPDMSPVTMLPAADQVNQTRLLLELIERNGAFQGGLWDGDEGEFGDRGPGDPSRMGDDDLFAPSFRREEDGSIRRDADPGRRDTGADRHGAGRDNSDSFRGPGGSRSDSQGDGRDSTGAMGLSDARFLPRMDLQRISDTLDRDRRPGADNLLDSDRFRAPRTSGLGFRDSDDERARTARMDAFRSLLGGASGVTSWQTAPGSAAGVTGIPAAGTPSGILGVPGRGLVGGTDLSGGLRGPGDDLPPGAPRSLDLPGRGLDLGLPGGGPRAGGLGETLNPGPSVRPMDLFQRKHDVRMPARVF